MKQNVKIFLTLPVDPDLHSLSVESVWALTTEKDFEFIIDNTPFFATSVCLNDRIVAEEREGVLWYSHTIKCSRYSLVRVVFFDISYLPIVTQSLRELGCITETLLQYKLLAASVPEPHTISLIENILNLHLENGILDYEEPILRD